ncbi:MAG: hypothetical protein Q9227_005168 [Pyrenula ochraceoflavens]
MSLADKSHGEATVSRSARLSRLFDLVLRGRKALHNASDGNLFLESICDQTDHSKCIERLVANPDGMNSLRKALRFDSESAAFLNGVGSSFIRYLAEDPSVKELLGGSLLQRVLTVVVDPPTYWNPLINSHNSGLLNQHAEYGLAWLISELLSWSNATNQPTNLYDIAEQKVTDTHKFSFLKSSSPETRAIGHKIAACLRNASKEHEGAGQGPGGRHDNDFPDFRQIAILPTADEIYSTERPFYRRSDAVEQVESHTRMTVHLDNQFRLLREDLLGELRNDLQIALGQKKGKRSGYVARALSFEGIDCGSESRRKRCGLLLRCGVDFPQLKGLSSAQRKTFVKSNFNFLKDRTLGCLMDGTDIVAFATLDRDQDLLAKDPPVLNLQISEEGALSKAILASKISPNLQFVQVSTPVFAYEPILKCLQQKIDLPLGQDLLPEHQAITPQTSSLLSLRPVADDIESLRGRDLQPVLRTPAGKAIKLDGSQSDSLRTGLVQALSLIQGPPGTGKSFIGALLAKAIHDRTKEIILVMCYTNHALDQFLEDLMDVGIPQESMVRLGSKCTTRTEPLLLGKQDAKSYYKRSQESWSLLNLSKDETETCARELAVSVSSFRNSMFSPTDILEYLEFSEESHFHRALTVLNDDSTDSDGMTKARRRKISPLYLWNRWVSGKNAGILSNKITAEHLQVWQMDPSARTSCLSRWHRELLCEQLAGLQDHIRSLNEHQQQVSTIYGERTIKVLKNKRIIGCTTTAAAMYTRDLQQAPPGIVLVEEAGEILESHILSAIAPSTKQIILIGDHRQLRPKINNYSLTVEKGDGYDLNVSLFERLVRHGYPHTTLQEQHRMSPEISALLRNMTYPDLLDSPRTHNRPPLRGFLQRIMFIDHEEPELDTMEIADKLDAGAKSSKRNEFEVQMVLKCVRYLAQQGYGTDQLVILTPYVGQLLLLREKLSKDNDPILNDLDSFDLVQAGLLPAASASLSKRPIKISTIDNYQGEESDIVIGTLTRSNGSCEIGFMAAPQRINVLLSRARNALILIGNAKTFKGNRRGKETWTLFFDQLQRNGNIYNGFPLKCERHPERQIVISRPEEFEKHSPDGGCLKPCGAKLNCGIHSCAQRCHQLHDHSKIPCKQIMRQNCPQGHKMSWQCHQKQPEVCPKCESERKAREKRQKQEYELELQREERQRQYAKTLADIDDQIRHRQQVLKDAADQKAQQSVISQRRKDLARLEESIDTAAVPAPSSPEPTETGAKGPESRKKTLEYMKSRGKLSPQKSAGRAKSEQKIPSAGLESSKSSESGAQDQWNYLKRYENADNDALDSLMDMIGLENVKQKFLSIKDKVDTAVRQNVGLKNERFGAALLGNPGTGKTTVARLYANFLATVGALPGNTFIETSGSSLANDGIAGCKQKIEKILEGGGGVMFIDEAYQLVSPGNYGGTQVLDYLLAEMENLTGKVAFILAGYNRNMEAFFSHNPGIPSRIPIELQFEDYQDSELLEILCQLIEKRYNKRMQVEGGPRGLYMRIVSRRLGGGRGREGFGNARAVQNRFTIITNRQAKRISTERRAGVSPDDNLLTKEDLIGPDPSSELQKNSSWQKLQNLIGLQSVKESVETLLNRIEFNYQRELEEKPLVQLSLNRVLLGSPGTGKTTVAKLYGKILADLGLLSNGEVVVKNPADFIGSVLGASESNTKAILASTMGKVLVIDEAYMLYGGDGSGAGGADTYKTSVVDTIVAEVQSTPGDDRCVLLVGYKDEMEKMFQNVNPGLSRRFPISSAFEFEDFSDAELARILELKLKEQGFRASEQAQEVAIDVLRKARNRPNFGNAGEVDILLGRAKERHLRKKSKNPDTLDARDFDEEFDRAERGATNCQKLFEGVIGCEGIISQMEGYQQTVANMKSLDLDPLEQIPFNFLFRGPPGTGKTSTARKMGKIFYDMGFLGAAQVIECSATDLVGQYVGQTAPKTQQMLEKALGRVLFVDEAYRLADGQFATEAMDEITDCLTKPKFFRKLIVILAGYDEDINHLMSINPGLTSRFPDTVVFNSFSPGDCINLLIQLLQKRKHLDCAILSPPRPELYDSLVDIFDELVKSSSWANARDVEQLAKNMERAILKSAKGIPKSAKGPKPKLFVDENMIISELNAMLSERTHRGQSTGLTRKIADNQPLPVREREPRSKPVIQTSSSTVQKTDDRPETSQLSSPPTDDVARDAGVSDAVWQQLQADKQTAAAREKSFQDLTENEKSIERKIAETSREDATSAEETKKNIQRNDDEDDEERRRREEERLKRIKQMREMQEQLERLRQEKERQQEERRKEELAQTRLRNMGVCVAGYRWIKSAGGYRCAGGSHWVSDGQLGL